MKIGVGLYGTNGHQIEGLLERHQDAELVATAAVDLSRLSEVQRHNPDIRHYDSLESMLKDERVGLVSLCSPVRRKQVEETVLCLEAGRHVYAEKPCSMTDEGLDAIIEASIRTGFKFHEMAGTAFEQPYITMRKLIRNKAIGDVVQVFAQKSYPYHEKRPQDEEIDGGLIMQVGIHAFRFIEHVAGQRIKKIHAIETQKGNPCPEGGLHIAASCIMELENGGVASVIMNYLNPEGFGIWGNEHLRVFGTEGFVESVDGGTRTRLIVGGIDMGQLKQDIVARDYFDFYIDELKKMGEMPLSLEEELHPVRMAIEAKKSTKQRGIVL